MRYAPTFFSSLRQPRFWAHTGGRQGGAAAGPLVPVDYGVGKQGQVVIGGHWVDASELDPTIPHAFQPSSGIGWDQPDPRELDPLTAEEAASCAMLAARVGESAWRTLPGDLQLAFVRDVYGNWSGCGWKEDERVDNTVALMRTCAKWRAEIGAEGLHCGPDLPKEDLFRRVATHSFSGT